MYLSRSESNALDHYLTTEPEPMPDRPYDDDCLNGYTLYGDGWPLYVCLTQGERRGWLAAQAADYHEEPGYSECAPYLQ